MPTCTFREYHTFHEGSYGKSPEELEPCTRCGYERTETLTARLDPESSSGLADDVFCPPCGHPAWGKYEWAPGHSAGYRCACHLRAIWKATLKNVTESLAKLPAGECK